MYFPLRSSSTFYFYALSVPTGIDGSNPCAFTTLDEHSRKRRACVSVRGRCVHSGGKNETYLPARWRGMGERGEGRRERRARAAVDHPEARCSLYPFYSRLLPSEPLRFQCTLWVPLQGRPSTDWVYGKKNIYIYTRCVAIDDRCPQTPPRLSATYALPSIVRANL